GVVVGGDAVAVDGADLVVMLRDLADGDLAAAGARLVLVDVLEAQVEARTRLDPRALDVPVRIHHAERRAARRGGLAGDAGEERGDEQKLLHAVLPNAMQRRATAGPGRVNAC